MKTLILILFVSVAYGQDSISILPGHIIIDQHDMNSWSADLQYGHWPIVEGDTIKDGEVLRFVTIYDPQGALKRMLESYMESRDSVEIHFIPGDIAWCSLTYPACNIPEHRKTVIKEPNFADFINFVLKPE